MLAIAQRQDKITPKVVTFIASTLFLFVCANSKIFLPHLTPVPITMHTFAIFVLGTLLPFRMSLPVFLVYFVEAISGSPIVGAPLTYVSSLGYVTFGYIVGMIGALYFLSQTAKKMNLFSRLLIADVLILAFGVLHLQFLFGIKTALMVGVVPFLIGNVVKLFAAYGFLKFTLRKRTV